MQGIYHEQYLKGIEALPAHEPVGGSPGYDVGRHAMRLERGRSVSVLVATPTRA